MQSINMDREVWEGWKVRDFIEHLELSFQFQRMSSKEEIIAWCKDEQPYYKKRIKEVEQYFITKAGL
jgi:hypothetical protein